MESATLLIGALSQRTGCHIETIRYYERINLLPRAERRGRYRTYSKTDVARLSFVMRSRELGFSIEEIRTLLALSSSIPSADCCNQAQALAAGHLIEVSKRIRDLQRMRKVLAQTISRCGSPKTLCCPLIEALSGHVAK